MLDWSCWPNFSADELRCRCGFGRADMNERFMDRLQAVRSVLGVPMRITSGFRCPDYNARVSSTGRNGPHTTGRAVDVAVSGETALKLVRIALAHGFTGIGVKQKGPHGGRFLHLDDLDADYPRPSIWSY